MNPIEREFFDLFCEVDGVGVKKALRAMVRPVQEVASQIEDQDAKGLATLPGIGPATAERIIAKLRRKVPKFALLVARDVPDGVSTRARHRRAKPSTSLRSLGHSEADARRLVDDALSRKKKYKDVDELLRAVTNTATAGDGAFHSAAELAPRHPPQAAGLNSRRHAALAFALRSSCIVRRDVCRTAVAERTLQNIRRTPRQPAKMQ